jgi:hypothetical protein
MADCQVRSVSVCLLVGDSVCACERVMVRVRPIDLLIDLFICCLIKT